MTLPIEQLQQLGLNKYEAEAYYTLLKYGPLTGYEVGKHSQVPLSRSYDTLERLVDKGLALIQPGEPSRYSARDPQHFLEQMRSSMEGTLNELSVALTSLSPDNEAGEFWIVRGYKNVLGRGQELIASARSQLELSIPMRYDGAFASGLRQAQERGVSILQAATLTSSASTSESILLLCDGHEVLLGTLAPVEASQAIVSANTALVSVVQGYFENRHDMQVMPASLSTPSAETIQQDPAWMDWEIRKQARLRSLSQRHRVA